MRGIKLASCNCQAKLARIAKMQALVAAAESTSNGGTPNSNVFPGTCTIQHFYTYINLNIYIYNIYRERYSNSSWWFHASSQLVNLDQIPKRHETKKCLKLSPIKIHIL